MKVFLLKGQWSFISDFTYTMNQIAWGIIIVAFFISILGLIWSIMRKPLSRFVKVKEVYVQIIYVPKESLYVASLRGVGNPFITVRFLNGKRNIRKFYMKGDDLQEGDRGILRYQGAYGLDFKKDSQIVQKDYYQRFGFKKKGDKGVMIENKKHHKRKYW